MAKTLYLMRHGQTLFNLRHKVQGWCDAPLTDFGIYQAKVAGQYFKDTGITFDDAYSSTQERACDTLELVTDGKIPYKRVKGLKEWNFGTFEGESEELNRLNQAKLLIIDDLGAERSTEFALEKVYKFIDDRYTAKKPLILTSNLTLDDMKACEDIKYSRIYDRIFEMCYPVPVKGFSWRKKQANERYRETKQILEG